MPFSPVVVALSTGALAPPLAALDETGALSRQIGLVLGVGLLVLVAALAVVLAVIPKTPRPDAPAEPVPEHDGTLTILPGRFLVEEGDRDVEIRIVRTGQSEREETTIGRDPGHIYRHVQLKAPSVSVRHAKLVCEGRAYSLVNYSRTNPTRVNGEPLPENASRRLVDGDTIEIGEVSIVYREV